MPLRKNQQRLFEFLKQSEASGKSFKVEDAAQRTGMSEASIRTYISKKLRERWVFPTDGSRFEVRGFAAVPAEDFAKVMSQKTPAAFRSVGEWREALEDLVRLGHDHGFAVNVVLQQIAEHYRK